MDFEINSGGVWYHGSNRLFSILEAGSTITQWDKLAEAFSHKPAVLCIDDDGSIVHNGKEYGYLYIIDEPVVMDADIYHHPRSSMGKNLEFLTKRELKVKVIRDIGEVDKTDLAEFQSKIDEWIKGRKQ